MNTELTPAELVAECARKASTETLGRYSREGYDVQVVTKALAPIQQRLERAERELALLQQEFTDYRVCVFNFHNEHHKDIDNLQRDLDKIRADAKALRQSRGEGGKNE